MKINKRLPLEKIIDALKKRLKDYENLIVDLRIKLSRKEREIFELQEQIVALKKELRK
jgi:SMC interacting uncharacterized protein involved in chromosome segregation